MKLNALLLTVFSFSVITLTTATSHAQDVSQTINSYYRTYLLRLPDASGHAHWINQIFSGRLTVAEVRQQFIYSAEAARLLNTQVYCYLGRDQGADAGMISWLQSLLDGGWTMSQVGSMLMHSTEGQNFMRFQEQEARRAGSVTSLPRPGCVPFKIRL